MKAKSVLVSLDPLSLPRLEEILAHARAHSWAAILEDRLPADGLDRVDGALVSLRGKRDQLEKVKYLRRRGCPVIDLTIACPKVKLPRVISDHRTLGALGAKHFLERGFVNFAWYSSAWSNVHSLRYRGYAETLGKAGFRTYRLDAPAAGRGKSPGRRKIDALPRPLAVLAFDESDAAHIIELCRTLRLDVPGDVAVMGIGNDHFLCENANIPISSVDQNLGRATREACQLLDQMMENKTPRSSLSTLHSSLFTLLVPPAGIIPRASTETLAHPDPVIRSALVFIHRNLHRPFGAAETSEAIGIPRSTLDHLFTEKIGHSIGTEILNQRILRAKRLLKDGNTRLKEIAAVCGFCNASYFTNIFRRETGLTPKAWRRNRYQSDSTRSKVSTTIAGGLPL